MISPQNTDSGTRASALLVSCALVGQTEARAERAPGLADRGLSDSNKQREREPQESSNYAASSESVARPSGLAFMVRHHSARLARLKKAVQVGCAEHEAVSPGGFRVRPLFVTLTYRPGVEWRPSHLRDTLRLLRAWLARRGHVLRYVSVAELQKRGAVHFHLVIWWPAHLRMPPPDSSMMWPHGSSNVQRARHPVAYLAKYASKGTPDGDFPCGIRMHSCGGLPSDQRIKRAFHLLPGWVKRASGGVVQVVRRGPKGVGGRVLESGEWIKSPFVILRRCPHWSWVILQALTDVDYCDPA